ncbi:MAG: hypothetical protein GC134_01120 [Proteobacteria bacterium]|nr:hypothetical protein [Pseudomonadota bacterium]
MRRKILSLFIPVVLMLPVGAHAVCIEPDAKPPVCTEQKPDKRFETEEEFTKCREEVDAYTSSLSDWVVCVMGEAKDRAAAAFTQFRCKTRADTVCFDEKP